MEGKNTAFRIVLFNNEGNMNDSYKRKQEN